MLTVDNPKAFDWGSISLVDCAEGNAMDSYFTLKLFELFEERLEGLGVTALYDGLISPLTEEFSEMEYDGLNVSREKLAEVGGELQEACLEIEETVYSSDKVMEDDNLSSTNDLVQILYTREDGFNLYPPDRTAKGKPSVSAPTLKILLGQINEELARRSK